MASGDRSIHLYQNLGCLLISSPQGHSGKTAVTIGLCRALARKGLRVQPFKKGPDYIDPSWLTVAAQRRCRNLDSVLMPKDSLFASFQQACGEADISVIEGAMGLYDEVDLVEYGSTAGIARLLNSPILLVVNTTRMTNSIAAMVTGYQHFEPDIHIAGVILNQVSGTRHERKLRDAVAEYCGIPVVGSIPRDPDLKISERHLGLVPSLESKESELMVERIGSKMEAYLDLDSILSIARTFATPFPLERDGGRESQVRIVKIGVVQDKAFHFYYPENLEALNQAGAELVFINSLRDRLPEIDGLYIGGGFPEFFLEELERNRELRQDITKAVERGLPLYAECAGMMYLCRTISWKDRSYEMVGLIPADVQLSEKPEGHGYVIAEVIEENPFFPIGLTLRGHEFHHSSLLPFADLQYAYQIKRGKGIIGKRDGIVYRNLFASYVHLHSIGTPEWARGFVSLASKEKRANCRLDPLKVCLN